MRLCPGASAVPDLVLLAYGRWAHAPSHGTCRPGPGVHDQPELSGAPQSKAESASGRCIGQYLKICSHCFLNLFYARFGVRVTCRIFMRTLFKYRALGRCALPGGPVCCQGPGTLSCRCGWTRATQGLVCGVLPLRDSVGQQPGSWQRVGSGVQQGRVSFPVPWTVASAGRLFSGLGQLSSRPSGRASRRWRACHSPSLSSQPGAPGRWGQAGLEVATWPCRGSSRLRGVLFTQASWWRAASHS